MSTLCTVSCHDLYALCCLALVMKHTPPATEERKLEGRNMHRRLHSLVQRQYEGWRLAFPPASNHVPVFIFKVTVCRPTKRKPYDLI